MILGTAMHLVKKIIAGRFISNDSNKQSNDQSSIGSTSNGL